MEEAQTRSTPSCNRKTREKVYYKSTNIYRGPDPDSDHYLVGIHINQIIPETRNQTYKKRKEENITRFKNYRRKNVI
jgi:hypothetical protein